MARTIDMPNPVLAAVGVTDRAAEVVRGSLDEVRERTAEGRERLAELQRRIDRLEEHPEELRDGVARRIDETYADMVRRGRDLARRIDRQRSTQDAARYSNIASVKAKTVATQASNAGQTVTSSLKATGTSLANAARATSRAATEALAKVGD